MNNIKRQVFSGFIWRFAERIGAQGISFIVSVILARILSPEDYGVIALITVFINILQVFVDSGMANALIQKEEADEKDFSTVFFFNIAICCVIYVIMFFCAPVIAEFYDNNDLIVLIRVLSITILISGVKNVQQAYVSRHMLFRRFFYSTLGGTVFSAIAGIIVAYRGGGVWALVVQQLSNTAIDTIILWITVPWRPISFFSWDRFTTLFSFGWKLLVSGLIDTVYTNLQNLIIGKKYSSSDLAYYNNGQKIPSMVVTNINTAIGSVLLPALAKEQNNVVLLKAHVRRAIQISSYILWPIMFGVAACADTIVGLVLTDKWLPAVPYLQIACLYYGMMPIHTANLQAITAMGRSDLFLKLEMAKKVLGVIILILSVNYGVTAIAISTLIVGGISTVINAWPNRKLLCYSYSEQIKDIMPSFTLSLVMAFVIWIIKDIHMDRLIKLIIQMFVGIAFYLGTSKMLHLESFEYILKHVEKIIKRKKEN